MAIDGAHPCLLVGELVGDVECCNAQTDRYSFRYACSQSIQVFGGPGE